jgi:hypothetical protein
MCEELRELGCFDDVPLNIAKHIISQRLHDLVDIEEHDVHRMAFKRPHRILNDERMIAVCWHEVGDCRYGVYRSPV